jgi:hypothetical protein
MAESESTDKGDNHANQTCTCYRRRQTIPCNPFFYPSPCKFWCWLVSFLSPWQKTWDKQLLRKEGLFWLTVLGVLSMVSESYYFGACGEAEHHGRSIWLRKMLTSCSQEAKRGRKGLGSQYPIQGGTSHDQLPPTRPYLLKVPSPSDGITGWWPSLLTHESFGTFSQNTACSNVSLVMFPLTLSPTYLLLYFFKVNPCIYCVTSLFVGKLTCFHSCVSFSNKITTLFWLLLYYNIKYFEWSISILVLKMPVIFRVWFFSVYLFEICALGYCRNTSVLYCHMDFL